MLHMLQVARVLHVLQIAFIANGMCCKKALDGKKEHAPITYHSIFFHSKLSTDNLSKVKTKKYYLDDL